MDSVLKTTAGTTASVAGAGEDWADTANATASDDAYATVALNNQVSDVLLLTNFGFEIPTDAAITGVSVYIEKKASGATMKDYQVKLLAPTAVGLDYAKTADWATSDTTYTYGGPQDLWGTTTLTPAIVNANTFGVYLMGTATGNITASINHIRMNVYYMTRNKRLN